MDYNEMKRSYDTARREQLRVDREVARITKELEDVSASYTSIDSSFNAQVMNDKARALEQHRLACTKPFEDKLAAQETELANTQSEYNTKKSGITYDNLLEQCSSKQEILEDVREASNVLGESLKEIVGNRFYNQLLENLESVDIDLKESDLPQLINYFNRSEALVQQLSNGKGIVENALTSLEEQVLSDDNTVANVLAVLLCITLVFVGKIALPIYFIVICIYATYNVFRNYRVYNVLVTQKAVQDNINKIDALLKQQIEDEVTRLLQDLDTEYLPRIEESEELIKQLRSDIINASASADASFQYDDSKISELKRIEIDKNDKRRSALLVQKKQQEDLLQEKTAIVTELGNQLNQLLNGLQQQFLQGVGKDVIFNPRFLFDIDTVKNRPEFFNHPQTSCLFLYEDAKDAYDLVRLLCVQLRARLNPFNLSVTVVDTVNVGQDLIYFAAVGDDSANADSLFKIITDDSDVEERLERYSKDLLRRQGNIMRDFGDIAVYNEEMIKIHSLTESYDFLFFIDPQESILDNSDLVKILRNGGKLGIFPHLFLSKENFADLKDDAVALLDVVGKVYYLENGNYLERAKDFVNETLLATDE